MFHKTCRLLIIGLPLAVAGGCSETKSSNPLSPSIAGPIAGVSISAPALLQPATNSQVSFDQQPILFVVGNSTSTGVRPLTYDLEIAIDSAFTTKVFSQTGIAPGTNGQTQLRMPQSLAADHTYFWHARAEDGANTGDYAAPSSFTVYTPVVIQPPALVAPADASILTTSQPKFTLTDSTHTGPVSSMSYVLEVATDAAFANKVLSVQFAETPGTTSMTPSSPLAGNTHFYWHALGTDGVHQSAWSVIASFTTPAAPAPAPVPTPVPGNGGGGGGGVDGINMSQATIEDNPSTLGSWPATANITLVDFSTGRFVVDFDKRDGPNRWPDSPFGSGTIEYTLGMCLNINGQWYCSAVVQFWYGRDLGAGGDVNNIAGEWFYDNRWGPLQGHQPAIGEKVGVFVAAGNLRDSGTSVLQERSAVIVIPWGTGYQTSAKRKIR